LKIQTHYLKEESKTLLINSNSLVLDEIYSNYEKVVFYDDSLPYAGRFLALNEIVDTHEYVILLHDIDILLSKNDETLERILEIMKEERIDRVDFQLDGNPPHTGDWYEHVMDIETKEILERRELIIDSTKRYLSFRTNGGYLYNVNPSFWKLKTFLNMMSEFRHCTYRNIEPDDNLQNWVRKNCKIYQLYSLMENRRKCGYFVCLDFFQFLHITHHGRLIPRDPAGQHYSLSEFASENYEFIYENFLVGGTRAYRRGMSEHEY
jgi:hypothetical protein